MPEDLPVYRDKESSKSWRQARLMNEQADPNLPAHLRRGHLTADVAARFRDNDIRAAQHPDPEVRASAFYDDMGNLKPDPNPLPPDEVA